MFKKERGITLIALVVTIIILLILAGVTLSLAGTQGGLFDKSRTAANKYEVEQARESNLVNDIYNFVEQYDDNP